MPTTSTRNCVRRICLHLHPRSVIGRCKERWAMHTQAVIHTRFRLFIYLEDMLYRRWILNNVMKIGRYVMCMRVRGKGLSHNVFILNSEMEYECIRVEGPVAADAAYATDVWCIYSTSSSGMLAVEHPSSRHIHYSIYIRVYTTCVSSFQQIYRKCANFRIIMSACTQQVFCFFFVLFIFATLLTHTSVLMVDSVSYLRQINKK